MKKLFLITLAIVLVTGFVFSGCAPKESVETPEAFYKGKTIEWIACASPGSQHDLIARVMAPYLASYLGATVVVKDLAGAGGTEGLNYIWNAKPDGLTLGNHSPRSLINQDIFDEPGALTQAEKTTQLGGLTGFIEVFYTQPGRFKSVADLKAKKGLKFTATSPLGGRNLGLATVSYCLDLDAKIVTGLSSKDADLAVIRGESDGSGLEFASYLKLKQEGQAEALFTIDTKRSPYIPDVPAITEVAAIPKDRMFMLEFQVNTPIDRTFFGPPGMPEDKIVFLKTVLAKIMEREDARQELEKVLGCPPQFRSGEDYESMAKDVKEQKQMYKEKVLAVVEKYRA